MPAALFVVACGGSVDLVSSKAEVGSPGQAGGNAGGAGTTLGGGAGGARAGSGGAGGASGGTPAAQVQGGAGAGATAGTGAGAPPTVDGERAPTYTVSGSWPTRPVKLPAQVGSFQYTRLDVHTRFLGESCAIGDYDNDGNPDVSSGRRWYPGPDFNTEHIYRGTPVSEYGHDDLPRNGDSPEIDTGVSDNWADFAFDVDADGYADIINVSNCDVAESKNVSPAPAPQPKASAYWYKNPGAPAGEVKWLPFAMHHDVRLEHHGLFDVDGDGFPELYGACKGCSPATTKGYYQGSKTNPTAPWVYHAVTTAYEFPFGGTGWLHGLGFGDVNGDGTPDLLERGGVWVNVRAPQPNLTLCPAAGCGWIQTTLYDGDPAGNRGGSHMYAADVDGDGDQDIIAADWAHGWGLAWYEQTAPSQFIRRQFLGSNSAADTEKYGPVYFSEPHSLEVADMNGDGVPDVITGKMRFAHPLAYGDPDPMGTPLVVVFEGKRQTPSAVNGGSVTFVPHVVDMQVGVGRQLAIGHLNTDGILDFCVASKLGLYVFLGQ